MSGRRIAKRACDGCKIRKIRCSQIAPCEGCTQAGIACTFVKQPGARGPRRPRRSTLDEIQRTQQEWQDLASTPPDEPVSHTRLDAESVFAPSKVAALVLQLCVYRLRMYPVWPIIKVERLVASLQKPQPDIEVFALAYAVAAATIAQIRSTPSAQHGGVTAEMMEAQCQFAKVRRDKGQLPDLTTVRIPFFLHMYYENIEPGGLTSITYLREAITIAHMVGLHRESYYSQVDPMEREIRRRTFWLLYVAERRIAVQYKLPVLLNTHISFPSTDDSDEHEVLLGFQKIVQLYWQLDQVGLFRSLDFHSFELANCAAQTAHIESMPQLLHSLRSTPLDTEEVNEIQAVDLQATTYWAQFLLTWLSQGGLQASNDLCFLAKAFLTCLNDRSEDSVEAYRPSLEMQVFQLATVLTALSITSGSNADEDSRVLQDTVQHLQHFLSGNLALSTKIREKQTASGSSVWRNEGIHALQPLWPSTMLNNSSDLTFTDDDFSMPSLAANQALYPALSVHAGFGPGTNLP